MTMTTTTTTTATAAAGDNDAAAADADAADAATGKLCMTMCRVFFDNGFCYHKLILQCAVLIVSNFVSFVLSHISLHKHNLHYSTTWSVRQPIDLLPEDNE